MRGFMWGFVCAAIILVGLMASGIVSVRYTGTQIVAAKASPIKPMALAQPSKADKADRPISRLPEIRVLGKDEVETATK